MVRTYTALVVVLLRPHGATAARRYEELQRIRHAHDAAYQRWLPHMTLIPPFQMQTREPEGAEGQVPDGIRARLDAMAAAIRPTCQEHASMVLQLNEVHLFPLRRYRNLHLRPPEACIEPLAALQKDVSQAMQPHIPSQEERDVRRRSRSPQGQSSAPQEERSQRPQRPQRPPRQQDRFVPHASLGQAYTPEDKEDIIEDATRSLGCVDRTSRDHDSEHAGAEGLQVIVDRIQLMYKTSQAKGPYTLWQEFPLTG